MSETGKFWKVAKIERCTISKNTLDSENALKMKTNTLFKNVDLKNNDKILGSVTFFILK